ncbi:hypothetical protein CAP50_00855 [Psychrobacter sp. L7]|nr:hypothetical protein CAP50_00855 [Psychrobacter sp. L7]
MVKKEQSVHNTTAFCLIKHSDTASNPKKICRTYLVRHIHTASLHRQIISPIVDTESDTYKIQVTSQRVFATNKK